MHASVVEQAMEVIRRTAANASAYKLDLRQVFLEFDTSGDGLLSCEEMVREKKTTLTCYAALSALLSLPNCCAYKLFLFFCSLPRQKRS